jgi:membrane protease YdiL (CAAX protease family)
VKSTPAIFDHLLFVFLVLAPLVEWRWIWPRYLSKLAAGTPGVRLRYLRSIVIGEWLPVLALLAVWAANRRPWTSLLLAGGPAWRLAAGLVFATLLAALLVAQRIAILKSPKTIERVRATLKHAEPLIPHTAPERRLFWLVSLTAGVCEETLYRGFMTWYLATWIGLVPAVILSSAIFGAGHIYLGLAQVPKTAFVGLIFAGAALASASLWPAMLLHAAMDWNSGELGFRILTGRNELEPTSS